MRNIITVKELCNALQRFDETTKVLIARTDYIGFRLERVGLLTLEFVTAWDDLNRRCRLADDEEDSAETAVIIIDLRCTSSLPGSRNFLRFAFAA
jgi:hypothetical protein